MASKIVLVIGVNGCVDAICCKLAQSEKVDKIFVLPGSGHVGTRPKIELINDISTQDNDAIIAFCQSKGIDLVFIVTPNLLNNAFTGALLDANIRCFGPNAFHARYDIDKSLSKDFMNAAQIPTARYQSFDNIDAAKAFINR